MILIFFGPPGSGKGTQAQYLVRNRNFLHVSTGELLRDEINRDTLLGREVRDIMERGDYISDDIIMALIEKQLLNSGEKHIILDGFPRTYNQVIELDKILDKDNIKLGIVIDFDIDLDKLIDRVSGRFSCRDCGAVYHDVYHKPAQEKVCDKCYGDNFERRADDQPEVLKNRIQKYLSATEVIKKHYAEKGKMISIDASSSPEEVRDSVIRTLAQFGFDI